MSLSGEQRYGLREKNYLEKYRTVDTDTYFLASRTDSFVCKLFSVQTTCPPTPPGHPSVYVTQPLKRFPTALPTRKQTFL
jgi:hypothetical protein